MSKELGLTVGESIDWYHGNSIRVATVLKVEPDRVQLQGMTSTYWVNRKTLERKLKREMSGPGPFSPTASFSQ
jgi:hypothetical protein